MRRATVVSIAVFAAWLIAAGIGNLAVPQLERVVETHTRSFMPDDAPSSIAARASAEQFGEPAGDNLNYVVLERNAPLTAADRKFYDTLIAALRADPEHVQAITDLWSDPVTADAAQSPDRQAVSVMLRLAGRLGTGQAGEAVSKLRSTLAELPTPAGLSVYVTGPGATIADEFSAIDRQMLAITAATVALILVLLLVVYRSPISAAIPLLSVGLALGVARPIIAALGAAGVLEVSLFSVALLAAMMLGAGTDYGIFLIGRYQEGRRRGIGPGPALTAAYRGTAPVVIGSGLTVSVALAVLGFADVGMLRSAGIPCAIGILVAMAAALTLTPALLALAARFGFAEPRAGSRAVRRWRRIGTSVARWPGPILVTAGALVFVLALPLLALRIGWDEPAATPDDVESNRGYAVADQHFPANHLLPVIVTVAADHDLRNPAGLIAIERITRALMEIPGVLKVQSASRPVGTVPQEATLTYQAGLIGDQLRTAVDSLTERLSRVEELDQMLAGLQHGVAQLGGGLRQGDRAFGEIGAAATDMQSGMTGLQRNVSTVSSYLDPLRAFVAGHPNCPNDLLCSTVDRVVSPVDDMVRSSSELSSGAAKLADGSDTAAGAFRDLPGVAAQLDTALRQARGASREIAAMADTLGPRLREFTDYLAELQAQFVGSGAAGFYLPQRALSDPRLATALNALISPDGRATRLLVFGEGREWSADGAQRARQVDTAVREATKEGTLTPTSVHLGGVGPATRDLQLLWAGDLRLLVGAVLVLIFAIMAVMLRSPVAGLVVVGTVAVSFASALGAAVLIWQHLLGHPLHWAVPPIAMIALVAVGADYNLLLALRLREEATAGIKTGVIRAFGATGGVVTTAGIVFGLTMAALLGSTVLSIAQIGSTIAVGLLIDTLVIRAFVVPALAVLLGRWFWWPHYSLRRSKPGSDTPRRVGRLAVTWPYRESRVGYRTASLATAGDLPAS